jgi:hypothetical protein
MLVSTARIKTHLNIFSEDLIVYHFWLLLICKMYCQSQRNYCLTLEDLRSLVYFKPQTL